MGKRGSYWDRIVGGIHSKSSKKTIRMKLLSVHKQNEKREKWFSELRKTVSINSLH